MSVSLLRACDEVSGDDLGTDMYFFLAGMDQ